MADTPSAPGLRSYTLNCESAEETFSFYSGFVSTIGIFFFLHLLNQTLPVFEMCILQSTAALLSVISKFLFVRQPSNTHSFIHSLIHSTKLYWTSVGRASLRGRE